MYEVKAHSRCGRDIVGSERWQRQLQQQSHISFQCLGSFEDTTYIWMPHVGEKATMVRESGNEHDRFIVAVLEDGTLCTVSSESLVFLGCPGPLFVRFIGGSALDFHNIGSGASFGSLLK